MIKYNLRCNKEHEFDSWFSDSNEFEKLKNRRLLECIYCNSKKIQKTIMAPMISCSKNKDNNLKLLNKDLLKEKNKLIKLREFVEKNYEFVGNNFSKKIREVYYNKKTKKGIYGTVSSKEKEELSEEGIDLLSIPWVNKDN